VSHIGITCPTTVSNVGDSSPNSTNHVGVEPLASASHAKSIPPSIVSYVGGIHTIEKPQCIGRNPKFLCRICKGGQLTRLVPTTVVVEEANSLSDNPPGSQSSLVSQHSNSCLIDTSIMPMQSSADTNHVFRSGASFDHVINISSLVSSEKESGPLSPSMLPPIPREVSFDWDGIVGYQNISSTPFHIWGLL